MSNMSYCRFHNTHLDLGDCKDALEEMVSNRYLLPKFREAQNEFNRLTKIENPTEDEELQIDEACEDMDELKDKIKGLSREEYRRAKWLIELCREIADEFDEDDLINEDEL